MDNGLISWLLTGLVLTIVMGSALWGLSWLILPDDKENN